MEIRLGWAGLALWILSGVVTAVGELATEGGLLASFLIVELIGLVVAIAIVLAVRSTRLIGNAAIILAGLAGLFDLLTGIGQVAEIAGGLAPAWLWLDAPLTLMIGAVYLLLMATSWRSRYRLRAR